jgi:hypothetical protein
LTSAGRRGSRGRVVVQAVVGGLLVVLVGPVLVVVSGGCGHGRLLESSCS